jgi:hypothetical protein
VSVAVLVLLLVPGCSLLHAPQKVVTTVVPSSRSKQPDPVELQAQLQRFTDNFSARTSQALDEYAQRVGTEAARVQALQLKLLSASTVIAIASRPNPAEGLLDMVAVVTLGRITVEDHWMKTPDGAAFEPLLRASRSLETNVWELAAKVLKPEQVTELREAINRWYATIPELRTSFFSRPQEFAALATTSQDKRSDVNSVFSLVGLDPMAGIDPAVREITRTRLFGERAMYTMQHMPMILRLQTELLVSQVARQPEVQLALTNTSRLSESADRISRAAEGASQVAAQLPDRLTAERKAILAALEEHEGKLRELMAAVDRPLVSAEKMSASLSTTITNFDALMKRFGVGEPQSGTTADSTNSVPFNILDYGTVAGQIAAMAKDLNTLITSVDTSLNRSTPQVQHLSQQASREAQELLNHAFRLGLCLVAVLLVGSVLAGLIYRVLANKLSRA